MVFVIIASNPDFTLKAATAENKVLFVSNRIGGVDSSDINDEIYLMDPDGSNVGQLTNNTFYDGQPCWSPDASKIAFESLRDGNLEIYIMNVDGTSPINLTSNLYSTDQQPSWGPAKIAFSSNRSNQDEIHTINSDGTGLTQLTTNGGNTQPAWSPDGQKIAYVSNGDIYVMNADGTNQTQLTSNSYQNNWPAWSPDGTKIAFASNRDWDWEIYVMNADGSNTTNLTVSSVEDDTHPTWSEDGQKIYFQSHRDGNWDVYQMNSSDGGKQTRLTKRAGDSFKPACFLFTKLDTWDQNENGMSTARWVFASGVVNDKIYVFGGYNGLSSVEEYNPTTKTWTTKTPMSVGRNYPRAAVFDNKVYVIGGMSNNTVSVYDPSNDGWQTAAAMSTSRAMPGVAVYNNMIYVFGGYHPTSVLNSVEVYDPITNTWTIKSNNMPYVCWGMHAAAVNDKIYIIGGTNTYTGSPVVLNTVEEYDPATDSYTAKASLPISICLYGISVVNNKIYVIGGYQNDTIGSLNTVYVYDPATDSWSTRANMPTKRCGLEAVYVNEKIYAIGGDSSRTGSTKLKIVEAYTP